MVEGYTTARSELNATLVCPGCKGPMRSVLVGSTPLFECTTCTGTWLPTVWDYSQRLVVRGELANGLKG